VKKNDEDLRERLIYVAGLTDSYAGGVTRAREVVRAGKGREALERLRRATNTAG